jgi:hypothetical protein
MHPAIRSLQPSDPDGSSIKADILDPQINRFAASETVTIHHQKQQMIPYALASSLSGIEKQFHLGWIKEVLWSVWIGGRTLNIIRCGEVEHWRYFP